MYLLQVLIEFCDAGALDSIMVGKYTFSQIRNVYFANFYLLNNNFRVFAEKILTTTNFQRIYYCQRHCVFSVDV